MSQNVLTASALWHEVNLDGGAKIYVARKYRFLWWLHGPGSSVIQINGVLLLEMYITTSVSTVMGRTEIFLQRCFFKFLFNCMAFPTSIPDFFFLKAVLF